MKTKILDIEKAKPKELESAALAVRNGALAVFATDTVYGIGTNALCPQSVKKIYSLKRRSSSKPLPILVDSIASLKKLVKWNKNAGLLAKRFWPGPLTLILRPKTVQEHAPVKGKDRNKTFYSPAQRGKSIAFGRGMGVRIPGHRRLLTWVKKVGMPVAATSANISGRAPCTRAKDALAVFRGRVEYILLGGDLPGIESSVVDLTGEKPKILRKGKIGTAVRTIMRGNHVRRTQKKGP